MSLSCILPTITEPSSPALIAIRRAGQEIAFLTISTPCLWSSVCALQLVQHLAGTQQSDAPPGEDAFLDRGPGRMHGIVNTILTLLHLDLGSAADTDHCNAARELGQSLLQLLTVVVGGGLLDLRLDRAIRA